MDFWIICFLAAAGTLTVGFLCWAIYLMWEKNRSDAEYERQLAEIIEDEVDEGEDEGVSEGVWDKFCHRWYLLYQNAGVARYYNNPSMAGRETLILFATVTVLSSLLSGYLWIGPAIGVGALVLLKLTLQKIHSNFMLKLNDQLPGFLFALKANIQASRTPEASIIKIADTMPKPLYDELTICKQRILAGQPFKESMEELAAMTTSRELEELARYMIIAAENGTSLEENITTVQEILRRKKELNDEKAKAIRATRPDLFVSIATIPAMFIATYMMSFEARKFWFNGILSWALLGFIIVMYLLGVWLVKKAVSKIDDSERR